MADLTSVFDDAHLRSYPKGQILLYQGEKTQNVFYIRKGQIKVYDITAQGTEKLMMILGPDDIFPLVWTFDSSDAIQYFYETFDDAEVCVIPRSKLVNAIKGSHELSTHLLEYFVIRTKDLMRRIECIDATSAKHKVGHVLAYLAGAHGDNLGKEAYKVRIPVTHQSIADMAGITRETASLQLKDIENENIYSNSSNSIIVHTDRLKRLLASE